MEYFTVGDIKMSRLALGAMRIADKPFGNIERLVATALEIGVNTFDHADIYGGGTAEELYGKVFKLHPDWRAKAVLQTKCGIRNGCYDLGYSHIVQSAESSLKRLNTEQIDILLLHRPDALMRPQQIARAFDELQSSGKVRAFGVSNFSAQQIDFLQSYVNQPLLINQLQLSATHCPAIDFGINVNTSAPEACDRTGGVLEYCRKNGITIQTYGTMQCEFTDETGHFYRGAFTASHARKKYFALNFVLDGLAQKYNVHKDAIAIAWVLHHPAGMQAIVGTTLDKRIIEYTHCCDVPLTDYEWYKIYEAAGHKLP